MYGLGSGDGVTVNPVILPLSKKDVGLGSLSFGGGGIAKNIESDGNENQTHDPDGD